MSAPRNPAYTWLLLIPLLLAPARGASQAYRWIDESGGHHYVQDLHQVPERFRRAGTYEEVGELPADVEEVDERPLSTASSKLRALLTGHEEMSFAPGRSFFVCAAALLITGVICFRYLLPALSFRRSRDEEPGTGDERTPGHQEEPPKRKPQEPISL